MEFNKKKFIEFRKDFEVAVKELEKKYEINLQLGSISYGQFDFTVKLTGKKADDGIEEKQFAQLCDHYGFKPSDYKREFSDGNDTFYLTGFNTKAPKNPCLIYCINKNKEYIASSSWVKLLLNHK